MEWFEKDSRYIWHPFTVQKNMATPIPVSRAKDTLLFDVDGREYIDAISSWWVTLHGHSNAFIAEKIYKQALQLEQVIFAGFTHRPAVELAEKLIQHLPSGFSRIFYSDNGSTSTEVAIKMAVQYWWNTEETSAPKRNKILAFKNSYHGDTFGAMSVSDRSVFTLAFNDMFFEVVFIDTPTQDNLEVSKRLIEEYVNEIAAFIYEPLVQGAGGMKMYEAAMMNDLLAFVQQHNIICIADEVMTGFGRTGKWFASEYIKHKPDIICMSKGLTGGTMALGATACTNKIYDAYVSDNPVKTFFHGHSFTANPLACTAALASMELMEQKETWQKIEWLLKQNSYFREKLIDAFHAKCNSVRCLGTILAFEINHGKNEYLNNISAVVTGMALSKGVYLRPLGNTVYIMPPYCTTEKELQTIYKVITEIISEVL